MEESLYYRQLKEDLLIKKLKLILHDNKLKPNWRETIEETIKLLEGE